MEVKLGKERRKTTRCGGDTEWRCFGVWVGGWLVGSAAEAAAERHEELVDGGGGGEGEVRGSNVETRRFVGWYSQWVGWQGEGASSSYSFSGCCCLLVCVRGEL